ncbi:MAG: HlyU family transcriptional regulator [Kiloniellales bacterium]
MGSKLAKLFGALLGPKESKGTGAAPGGAVGEAVDYKGFSIRPAPRREGSQWLTAGVITKQIGDELKEQHFIRADFFSSKEEADSCALRKARQIIDEQGEKLFS